MAESAFSERIVQNLLDTDFYKLTMMQAVLHNYPNAEVEWEFRCRNQEDLRLYLPAIREQLEYLAGLAISDEQLAFLERIPFLAPDFIRFLGLFRFNPRYVQTGIENDEFFLRLKGPWLHVILFEVPLLAMISEVRNRARYPAATVEQARERLQEKFDWLRREASAEELAGFKMADFGTRRRFSYRVHEAVVSGLKADGLDLPRALKIYRALQGRINVSFGIGTHFTCDLPGVEPMNIVVKMSACNGHPVAKISDTPGKAQCRDPDFIHYLKHVFQVA